MWVDRRADTSTRARNGSSVPMKYRRASSFWRKFGFTSAVSTDEIQTEVAAREDNESFLPLWKGSFIPEYSLRDLIIAVSFAHCSPSSLHAI
jgi:hypothetical protein